MDLVSHLEELVRASSITGREGPVAELLAHRWSGLVHESTIDRLGSYIGLRRGAASTTSLKKMPLPGAEGQGTRSGPARVMVAAHIDSIGGMVTAIERGGFLRFTTVGGVDRRLLLAQEVEVHGSRIIPGLIGTKPPHMTSLEERNKLTSVEQLFIDTGLSESEVRDLVRVGAPVLPRFRFSRLQNNRFSSRYMDNRASLVAVSLALAKVGHRPHEADIFAVGTVGEEFGGMPGAATATYAIKPDIGIAVDVTFGKHPGSEEDSFAMGAGPAIGVGPNCTPGLTRVIRKVAEDLGIRYALEVMPGHSGTDAWPMQVVRGGVATGIVSIPLRYMHTAVETVDLADIQAAGRLLAGVIGRVDLRLVEELSCC